MIPTRNRVVETKPSQSIALKTSITAIMAALTCVVTMLISIYIPSSNGFFNIGESIVYLSAILFGPYIGALSGGIGSMVADLFLGYPHYAVGTLIIKGLEGLAVGFIYKKFKKGESTKIHNTFLTLIVSLSLSIGILTIGLFYYIGVAEINSLNLISFTTDIRFFIWIIISSVTFIGLNLISKFSDPNIASKIISMFIGGIIIVVGYLLYGTLILSETLAYLEIPFNFLQSLLGIAIAIPLTKPLENKLRI